MYTSVVVSSSMTHISACRGWLYVVVKSPTDILQFTTCRTRSPVVLVIPIQRRHYVHTGWYLHRSSGKKGVTLPYFSGSSVNKIWDNKKKKKWKIKELTNPTVMKSRVTVEYKFPDECVFVPSEDGLFCCEVHLIRYNNNNNNVCAYYFYAFASIMSAMTYLYHICLKISSKDGHKSISKSG